MNIINVHVFLLFAVFSIAGSWVSLAIAITSFYAGNRSAIPNKSDVTTPGLLIYILWRLAELAPRFLLLGCFASEYYWWFLLIIGPHFLVVLICVCCQQPDLTGLSGDSKTVKILLYLVCSLISVFSFVNLIDGETKRRAVVFYICFHLENILMMGLLIYRYYISPDLYLFVYILPIVLVVSILLQIIFQILFYRFFHKCAFSEGSQDKAIL